ncbi:MAG: RNA-binding domain-containing protein [archaeon]
MADEGIIKTIRKGESEVIELKKSTAQMERALKSTCAFLNHKGGTIYFGVSDGDGKIVGQEVSDSTLKSISQKIRQRIKPEISPEIKVLELEGKNDIEVKIKEGNNKLYYLDGIAYKRAGTENPVISPDEIEKIILEKKKKYWDSDICEGATLADIDAEKVKWFLNEAKKERGLDISESSSIKDALLKLKLTHVGNLTNAAILLFGKKPQDFFFSAEVKCIRFKGKNVTEPMIDMKIISGNIIDHVTEIEKFIFDHIRLESWIEERKIQRQEKWEYPPKAIREAIVNAVCHRDYTSQSNAQIRVFDDRMEFWNPGSLPIGWTVENLKHEHESKPFNPLIAKQFFWIKYIEDVGSGTNKILNLCKSWGFPEPVFEFTGTSIVVNIRKPLAKEELLKLGLNERQIKAIEYAEKSGLITNRHYQELNNVSKWTAIRDLADLVEKGVFIASGKGRELKYLLVQNAP